MNDSSPLSTVAPDPLMKPSPVAATAASDPTLFSGIMNVQSSSGSGQHSGHLADAQLEPSAKKLG